MKYLLTPRTKSILALGTFLTAALLPTATNAGTNSIFILTNTFAALPSCVSYSVKGVCVFLRCSLRGCRLLSSIRVAHYVPDAIISTYNEPLLHPWDEIGKPLATTLNLAGSAMLGVPYADASAGSTHELGQATTATFKGADAIGNPAGMFAFLLADRVPALPSLFKVPGYTELVGFPRYELPNIANEWRSVPADAANGMLTSAREMVAAPTAVLNKIASIPATLGQIQTAAGKVSDLVNRGGNAANMGMKLASFTGVDMGPLRALGQLASLATGASPISGSIFCPGNATAFTLFYQSELDSLFWRGVIPTEMMYPSTWIPGRKEIASSTANTWGSVYPRTGEVVQSNPAKASAVLASRVADIISKRYQAHIYTKLDQGDRGFKYFSRMEGRKWQMLYPQADRGCQTFGSNDSLNLASFADGKQSDTQAYMWNVWHKYDCCLNRGSFLFSVP